MRKSLFCGLLVLSLLPLCGKKDDQIVAKIGWRDKILRSDLVQAGGSSGDLRNQQVAFENILREHVLYSAALRMKFHKKPEIAKELDDANRKWIISQYRSGVIKSNYGFMESDLKKYYSENRRQFPKQPKPVKANIFRFDSLSRAEKKKALDPTRPFPEVMEAIMDSLIIRNSDLHALYESQKKLYRVKAHANVSHVFSTDSLVVRKAVEELGRGMRFEEAVKKFSEDSATKSSAGQLGMVWKDDPLPNGIGLAPDFKDIVFGGVMKAGQLTPVIKSTTGFHLFLVREIFPESVRPFEEVLQDLRRQAMEDWKNNTEQRIYDQFRKESKFQFVDTVQQPSPRAVEEFYAAEVVARAQDIPPPPLDSIRDQIHNVLISTLPESFDSSFVFVRGPKKFRITQADLTVYLRNIPDKYRERYRTRKGRMFLVNLLAFDELIYQHARAVHFDRMADLKTILRNRSRSFLAHRFGQEYLDKALGFSDNELKHSYAGYRDSLKAIGKVPVPAFDDAKAEIAIRMIQNPPMAEGYYRLYAEELTGADTTILPFADMRETAERAFLGFQCQEKKKKAYELLKKLVGVKILAKEFQPDPAESDSALFKRAQSIVETGENLEKAAGILVRIRSDFPATALGDEICFSLGQIYSSLKKYPESVLEFRKLLRLFPESAHNYKAQFMIGFTYSEYLQNMERAQKAFSEVIEKYPDSELVDDAQFMIKYLGKDLSKIEFLKQDTDGKKEGKKETKKKAL